MEAARFIPVIPDAALEDARRHAVDEWGLVMLPGFVLWRIGEEGLMAAAALAPGSNWVFEELVAWWEMVASESGRRIDDVFIQSATFYTREAVCDAIGGEQGDMAGRTIGASLWSRLDRVARGEQIGRAA